MPNKPLGIGMAWLEGKSYNMRVVYIMDVSIRAGSTSERFKEHTDQARIHSNRTAEISSMSTSLGN